MEYSEICDASDVSSGVSVTSDILENLFIGYLPVVGNFPIYLVGCFFLNSAMNFAFKILHIWYSFLSKSVIYSFLCLMVTFCKGYIPGGVSRRVCQRTFAIF